MSHFQSAVCAFRCCWSVDTFESTFLNPFLYLTNLTRTYGSAFLYSATICGDVFLPLANNLMSVQTLFYFIFFQLSQTFSFWAQNKQLHSKAQPHRWRFICISHKFLLFFYFPYPLLNNHNIKHGSKIYEHTHTCALILDCSECCPVHYCSMMTSIGSYTVGLGLKHPYACMKWWNVDIKIQSPLSVHCWSRQGDYNLPDIIFD